MGGPAEREVEDRREASTEHGREAAATVELTILMPCLNEARTLEPCIRKGLEFLARHGVDGEVLVADNGSTDGSQELARRAGARVVDVAVRGYGAALYHGARSARGRYIVMGDSDDSYDFSRLDGFLARLRAGDDLVMGNRFQGGIMPGAMPWKNRYLGNPVLSFIGKALFRAPVGDFHCGQRGFSSEAFARMDLRTTGMEFASEMVIKATLMQMRISEVPVVLHKDGRDRAPHLRPWRDGWRHLRFMLLYSPRWLFLYPGLAFVALGLLVGLSILPGPVVVGRVGFDVHSLLFASMAVVLGFQGVAFWFLVRAFAFNEGLLPRSVSLPALFRHVTLETGLLSGFMTLTVGLGIASWAIWDWGRSGFGSLDPRETLRVVIPATTAIALGVEALLMSVLFSMFGLARRG